jgi:hypothetical protein
MTNEITRNGMKQTFLVRLSSGIVLPGEGNLQIAHHQKPPQLVSESRVGAVR